MQLTGEDGITSTGLVRPAADLSHRIDPAHAQLLHAERSIVAPRQRLIVGIVETQADYLFQLIDRIAADGVLSPRARTRRAIGSLKCASAPRRPVHRRRRLPKRVLIDTGTRPTTRSRCPSCRPASPRQRWRTSRFARFCYGIARDRGREVMIERQNDPGKAAPPTAIAKVF